MPGEGRGYRAAAKRSLAVFVVSNGYIQVPAGAECVVVGSGQDAADDWIADRCGTGDAVVTADIGLASRCVKSGAAAMSPTGREFTDDNIGAAVGMRDLMKQIRQATGREIGPKAFSDRDRRRFMREFSQLLDRLSRTRDTDGSGEDARSD